MGMVYQAVKEELVYPKHLKACPLDALTQLIRQVSHGKLAAELGQALVQSARASLSGLASTPASLSRLTNLQAPP